MLKIRAATNNYFQYQLVFQLSSLFNNFMKFQKIAKNGHHNIKETKLVYSNCLFHTTTGPKPKYDKFTLILDSETITLLHFCLNNSVLID